MTIWEYSETNSYKKDDICLHDGSMYVALVDMNPGPWTAAVWSKIETFKPAINKITSIIGDRYNSNNTYNYGDFCIRNDILYKCIDDGVTGVWNSSKWAAMTIAEAFEPRYTWSLYSTETADGTSATLRVALPLGVNGIFVKATLAAASSNAQFGAVVMTTARHGVGDIAELIRTETSWCLISYTRDGNFWNGYMTQRAGSQQSSPTQTERIDNFVIDSANASYIEFRTLTSGAVLPNGSMFTIYVRR
jgi:hypothetical protein